jgi:hypothetical protein
MQESPVLLPEMNVKHRSVGALGGTDAKNIERSQETVHNMIMYNAN